MQVGTERPVGRFATDQLPKDLRYEGSLDVNTIIDIREIDNVISKPLYQHTQRGRVDVLTPAMFPYFIHYIHDLRTKYPGFEMNLVTWNQLRNDEYIFEL